MVSNTIKKSNSFLFYFLPKEEESKCRFDNKKEGIFLLFYFVAGEKKILIQTGNRFRCRFGRVFGLSSVFC